MKMWWAPFCTDDRINQYLTLLYLKFPNAVLPNYILRLRNLIWPWGGDKETKQKKMLFYICNNPQEAIKIFPLK